MAGIPNSHIILVRQMSWWVVFQPGLMTGGHWYSTHPSTIGVPQVWKGPWSAGSFMVVAWYLRPRLNWSSSVDHARHVTQRVQQWNREEQGKLGRHSHTVILVWWQVSENNGIWLFDLIQQRWRNISKHYPVLRYIQTAQNNIRWMIIIRDIWT